MPVATTALFDTITQLLVLFRADSTLTANKVFVNDGPILLDASQPNILFVGGNPPDDQGSSPVGQFNQRWGELGARAKYEDLTVHCELWVRTGNTDIAAARSLMQTLLAAIESALRLNFTLTIVRVYSAQIESGELHQIQSSSGATLALPFTLAVKARLASQ